MTQRFRSFAGQPVLRFIRDPDAAAQPQWRRPELETRFVQPGLTIGADPDCAVSIDGPGIKDIHVRISRDERGRVWAHAETSRPFETLDDQSVWALELKPGERFRVGHVLFECDEVKLEQHDDERRDHEQDNSSAPEQPLAASQGANREPPAPAVSAPEEASRTPLPPLLSMVEGLCCPQCRSPVAHLPPVARYCPRCGAVLPENRPPAPEAPPPLPEEHAVQLLGWLMPLVRSDGPRGAISAHTERPATLIAYINTLLHLGLRYEAGIGGTKNLAQALRYYRKAAKLGNELAQARVAVDAARPARESPDANDSSARS